MENLEAVEQAGTVSGANGSALGLVGALSAAEDSTCCGGCRRNLCANYTRQVL